MITVEVALIGAADSPPPGPLEPGDWERPWEYRPRTELQVDDDEPLSRVIDRASEAFGLQTWYPGGTGRDTIGWVAFDDGSGHTSPRERVDELALVSRDGRLVFGVRDFRLIPYGQLVRTFEAGVLRGDPRRLYLIRQVPQGDFGGAVQSWDGLVQVWDVAWRVLERIEVIGGVAGAALLLERLRARFRRGRDAADRHAADLGQRGATPGNLSSFLTNRGLDADQLALLLGTSPEDAEALADALVPASAIDDPQESEIIALIQREVAYAFAQGPWTEGGTYQLLERRLEIALSTGERPPPVADDLFAEPLDLDADQAGEVRDGMPWRPFLVGIGVGGAIVGALLSLLALL